MDQNQSWFRVLNPIGGDGKQLTVLRQQQQPEQRDKSLDDLSLSKSGWLLEAQPSSRVVSRAPTLLFSTTPA